MNDLIPFGSWSVLTADFLILLHLTIGGVTFSAILHLASAKWRYHVRSIAVSLFALYPLVLGLLVVLLLARHQVFPWMGSKPMVGIAPLHTWMGAESPEALPLNGWHNPVFLAAREILGLLVVGWLYRRFIRLQEVSERSEADWDRFKATANWIPVAHVLYGTMIGWDFEMTMLPSWESSIYGMYHFVSNFGMFLATMAVLCYKLGRAKVLARPLPDYVLNYFAQMMLAFTILWTYTWFAQYLTYWYGNIPEERNRLDYMANGDYSWLWWSFFCLKFLIPFCFLVFTYFRHSPVSIYRIAVLIILGTWLERFTWIAGSVGVDAFTTVHMPFTGAFDVVVTVVLAAAAWFLVRRSMVQSGVLRTGLGSTSLHAA